MWRCVMSLDYLSTATSATTRDPPLRRLRRARSRQQHTPRRPGNVKSDIGYRIGQQCWQFPANAFVRMVCHKERKSEEEVDKIKEQRSFNNEVDRPNYYTFDTDDLQVQRAATRGSQRLELRHRPADLAAVTDEPTSYTPLAQLFNLAIEGMPLVHCRDPADLLMSILHCLLGYLNLLQRGFIHRDISIGSLLCIDYAVIMNLFHAEPVNLEFSKDRTNVSVAPEAESAQRLTWILESLQVKDKARGFIIDADNAARWSSFADSRAKSRSGTAEFMSRKVLQSKEDQTPYLHSPVDDFSSFFYVTQWAAVFRPREARIAGISQLRKLLAGNDNERAKGSDLILDLEPDTAKMEYGRFLSSLPELLTDWKNALRNMLKEWSRAEKSLNEVLSQEEMYEKWTLLFLTFGCRGVAQFAELILKHDFHSPST
ncbi:hypothetical protein MKEN_00424300 [Mycena kentingensis (nom. inval.)]|nr:hypothetical protein MKEN_00424300 [Mycena kentingensis (nom. inval.)]